MFLFEFFVVADKLRQGNGSIAVDVHPRVEGTGHGAQEAPILLICTVVQVTVYLIFADVGKQRKMAEKRIPLPRIDPIPPAPADKPSGKVYAVLPRQIVVAEDEVFSAAQAGKILFGRAIGFIDEVADDIHVVVFADAAVPVANKRFIHFLHGRERSAAHTDDLGVTEVQIGSKEIQKHPLLSYFTKSEPIIDICDYNIFNTKKQSPRSIRGDKFQALFLELDFSYN